MHDERLRKLGVDEGGALPRVRWAASGVPGLDQALGGGWARGRLHEVFGPEAGGKTSVLLAAVAEEQRTGGVAAFIDAERALDPAWAVARGVDLGRLLVGQPDNGEAGLEMVERLVESCGVALVVVDSVAALIPRVELEADYGDAMVGLHERLMSAACRRLAGACGRTGATVIFANQVRPTQGLTFGPSEVPTGGNALKFYATSRVQVRRVSSRATGITTELRVVKNKVAPPFRTARADLGFDGAWGPASEQNGGGDDRLGG